MWPNRRWTSGDPPQGSNVDSDEEEFKILAAPLLTTGSPSQAPHYSTDNSIDFSELLTKPEKIIESPRAPDWDLDFAGLSNLQSAKSNNPSNRF